MSKDQQTRLSEEMAERLWKRAAELQAEASQRAEAKAIADAESEVAGSMPQTDSGYALAQVREAAVEAGISTEFVDAALTELTAVAPLQTGDPSMWDKVANSVLGRGRGALEIRRDISASPQEVSQAMERILLSPPYSLSLTDATGDLLNGGVMVFDIPPILGISGYTTFQYEASWASLKQLMISIHPTGPESCQLVVRAPLLHSRRLSGGIAAGVTTLGGVVGALAGMGIGVGIGALLGLDGGFATVLLRAGTVLMGAGIGAPLAGAGFRALFQYGLSRGQKAMDGLAGAIGTTLTVGWGQGPAKDLPKGEEK